MTATLVAKSVNAKILCMYFPTALRRRAANPHGNKKTARASSEASLSPIPKLGLLTSALVRTPIAIVNVVVAAVPEGVMVDGEKLQVAFAGSPEQVKLIC